ncbi:MAG: hydrogenase maturation nickel metallochaperone HypA [Desulfuromonadales bacterium]|nr:hydrogenase maturation nickel metallochaperone HypA [Desulfuromonadales bacterium]
MHEFSIVSSLLDLVEADVRKHHARSATRVVVRIGDMSGVVAELLAEAFHVCKRGTLAEQAELVVEKQEVLISCHCGYKGPIKDRRFICPVCGVADIEVTAGEEMILQQLEMEVGE